MSLTETKKDQLAGPRRLEELPPPSLGLTAPRDDVRAESERLPVVDIVPDSLEIAEPSFLVHARALAMTASHSAMARSRLAQAELSVGSRSEASRHALESLELPSADGDDSAVFSAIQTLFASGEDEAAEKALEKFVKPGPLTILYATLAARRDDLDTAFERLGDDESLDAWELRGWIALQQSHFDQAIRFYRKALNTAESSPALMANLGLAHAAVGAPDKAIAETKRALALGPIQRQRVGLNLVAFLASSGASDDAFKELRRLQDEYPTDIELIFAEAHWALAVGDAERAERRLRYARTSLWDFATELQKGELIANRAYLRYYQGKISSRRAVDILIEEMRKTEWRSTRLVSMFPILLCRYSDARRLAKARDELESAHPGQKFRVLDLHLAVLRDDLTEATRQALQWTDEALFTPEASTWAVFLLTQVEDRFEEAVKLGRKALRRMPAATILANNVAYSLALAGDGDQAKSVLLHDEDGPMVDLATQGLIWATKGNIAEANRLYDLAEEAAERGGDSSGPQLVNLHRRLIAFVAPGTDPSAVAKPVSLPLDWDDHPALVQCLRMLTRRNVPLDDISIDGGIPLPDSIEPRLEVHVAH